VQNDILERLRIDPGRRTLGELLQDREAAAHEITKLRSKLLQATSPFLKGPAEPKTKRLVAPDPRPEEVAFRPGTLLRLAEVCRMLALSRSTVYKRLSEQKFPKPVRLGSGTVRWRIEAIEAWRDGHAARIHIATDRELGASAS
jgi:prophage regulatory protein